MVCFPAGSLQQISGARPHRRVYPILHERVSHLNADPQLLLHDGVGAASHRPRETTVRLHVEERAADGHAARRFVRRRPLGSDDGVRRPGGRNARPAARHLAAILVRQRHRAALRSRSGAAFVRADRSADVQRPHDVHRAAAQHTDIRHHLSGD